MKCPKCNFEIDELTKTCPKCKANINAHSEEIQPNNKNQNNNVTGCAIVFIVAIIFFAIIGVQNTMHSSSNNQANSNYSSSINDSKPDEVELMTYAQMVLDDNLSNPNYSSYKGDYTFIGTGLRYKIEGKVDGENFWMIIEFVDNTYKEYDLISLQVGNNIIYKK